MKEKDFDNPQEGPVPKTANISHALILLDAYFLLDGRNIGCPRLVPRLLRQYFPKGTYFRTVSEKEVAIVVKKLNNRPRKCLNYQTPYEAYCQALHGCGAL